MTVVEVPTTSMSYAPVVAPQLVTLIPSVVVLPLAGLSTCGEFVVVTVAQSACGVAVEPVGPEDGSLATAEAGRASSAAAARAAARGRMPGCDMRRASADPGWRCNETMVGAVKPHSRSLGAIGTLTPYLRPMSRRLTHTAAARTGNT